MARSASSQPERGAGALIIGISSLAGLVAALAGGLVAGGDPPKLLVGAAIGLVVGALGALGVIAVVDRRLSARGLETEERGHEPFPAIDEPGRGAIRAATGVPAAGARAPIATTPISAAPAAFDDEAAPVRARSGGVGGGGLGGGVPGGGARPMANLEALVTSIGHRYQFLADRQLAALDELAGREPEDGKLALATRLARRMRRTSKTLQVLADDPDSRESARTATIAEVIAAAIADNDEYTRIDYRSLHPAQVDGEAVPDVVHLLAELIDNAVSSSTTNGTSVTVLGRRSANDYILSVVDEGSGMAANQRDVANERVHTPPALTQQSPAAFGLPTVGRLAARHDIVVTLLEAATDGVIAKVRLPARVVGGQLSDPAGRRAKDRPAVGGGAGTEGAGRGSESVIDLRGGEAQPAAVGAGPARAATGSDATVGASADQRSAAPDPSARAELARQVQRNRSNPQEGAVRNPMQPASLDRPAERSRPSTSGPKDDAPPRAKDGKPNGRG